VLQGCVPSNCVHMQQQWAALEHAYLRGQARAIGVSNYCEQCVRCLLKTAKITPMVNQVQYHIGMGAGYPEVLPSHSCACIGSLCLRHCGHGSPID
jgi:diketogulonate reductase-like aldo/keto reductase